MSQDSGAGIQTGGVHHARLTVSDPARSREFYTGVLGFDLLMDFPDGFLVKNGSLLLALRTAPDASKAAANDRFDPNRVGLDHLSLVVGGHADLETAVGLCKARGVTCGEIVDFGPTFGFFVLMLEDPDGIQIELVANYV
jgi:glyoxylase I family protein